MAVVNTIYKGVSRIEAIPSVKHLQRIKTILNQCIQYRIEKTAQKQPRHFNSLEIIRVSYQSIEKKVFYTLHLQLDVVEPEKAKRFQAMVNNWLKRYLPKCIFQIFEYETHGKVDKLLTLLEKEPHLIDEIQRIVLIPPMEVNKRDKLIQQVQTNPDNLVFIQPLLLGSVALYGFSSDLVTITKGINDIDRVVSSISH